MERPRFEALCRKIKKYMPEIYEQFLHNAEHHPNTNPSGQYGSLTIDPPDINWAIHWADTSEGWEFWRKMNARLNDKPDLPPYPKSFQLAKKHQETCHDT